MIPKTSPLFFEIKQFISTINSSIILLERLLVLQPLIDYIQNKTVNNQEIRLNFICTHNSRRSHLSQIWAQTMAFHFDIKNVFCYSGGTESTTIYPTIITNLEQIGFEIEVISRGENSIYSTKFAENQHPIIGFSKKIDSCFNPKSAFAAILTCSQADGDCPFIFGAEKRIPIAYDDPKIFDNTPLEVEKYAERNQQIATELFYVFSKIKN